MKKYQLTSVLMVVLMVAIFALPASAALVNCGGYDANTNAQKPCEIGDLVQTVVNLINFLLAWAWIVAMFFILWAAYGMIGSSGNEEEVTKAKTTFKNAVLGLFLVMAMFLLINWVVAALTGQPVATTADALIKAFNIIGPK